MYFLSMHPGKRVSIDYPGKMHFCPENISKTVIPAGRKPESRVSRENGNLFPYSGFPLNRLRE